MPGQASASTASDEKAEHARILVIDDEVAILRLVKTMLARSGYEVTTAESADEGLKLMAQASFDCVITDAVMPTLSGYDFVKTVRGNSKHADLPVLMLTRKRHRQDVKKAVEAGVTDYVLKPIDEQLLLDKVEMCMRKGGGTASFKRQVYEHTIHDAEMEAELGFSCRIIALSETDLTLRVPFSIDDRIPVKLRTRLFEEIGISQPMLKLQLCERAEASSPAFAHFPWEARLSFVGTPESDLQKIRAWLQRQSALRRK
jgi:DNA-binding response OmpR family regulator